METLPKLSPAQNLLLRTAARRADGRVIPPDTLRGGSRVKVLTALLQRGWIEPADGGHLLTDAGYAAIGQQRHVAQDDVPSVGATDDLQRLEGIPVRPGTKLAALVVGHHPLRYALRRHVLRSSQQFQAARGSAAQSATGHEPQGEVQQQLEEGESLRPEDSLLHRQSTPRLPDRLDAVRRISHNFGYDVVDDMNDLLAEYGILRP